MLKVIFLTLGCSKFLFLVLDVKSSCFYSWILKVFTFVLWCWRFLLLFLNVEGFYFYYWMLKVCDYWFFVYLHILKKNDVKIYSILFTSWFYKISSIYNDEKFMKGNFLKIIMLHMSCFVFEHLWWLLLFLCYRAELSLCFNPSTSKLCIKVKLFQKYLKLQFNLPDYKHNIWFYLQV